MAANVGTLKLELIVDDKGSVSVKDFSKTMQREFGDMGKGVTRKLGGALKTLGRTAGSTFKRMKNAVFSLKTAFIGLVVYGMNRLIKGWERLSGVQEKAEAGMRQAMTSMGRYTEVFEQEILDTASALQSMSTFGDEAVLMGTKFLMTYKAIGDDVMPETMKAMTDLAALMKGDFVSAANMLGKASMGMTGELRRVGITVDKATFESEGYLGVLAQIQEQVEGQAAALRDTKMGGLEAFGNVVGDVKEKFGLFTSTIKAYIADEILPYVEQVNEKLQEWIDSGLMEEKARQIGEAISTWVVGKVDWAIKKFHELKEKAGEAARNAAVEWGKFTEKLKLMWKVLKPILEGLVKVGGWLAANKAALGYALRLQTSIVTAGAFGMTAPAGGTSSEEETRAKVDEIFEGGTTPASSLTGGGASINNYFNQSISRSDVTNIIAEQARRQSRR